MEATAVIAMLDERYSDIRPVPGRLQHAYLGKDEDEQLDQLWCKQNRKSSELHTHKGFKLTLAKGDWSPKHFDFRKALPMTVVPMGYSQGKTSSESTCKLALDSRNIEQLNLFKRSRAYPHRKRLSPKSNSSSRRGQSDQEWTLGLVYAFIYRHGCSRP